MKNLLIATCALLLLMSSSSHAQVPQLMNYQGRIQVGTNNFDGIGQFKFALVGGGGPNAQTYWRNDGGLDNSEPATSVSIPVTKGLYSVLLGDATKPNMSILPTSAFNSGEVYLRIWFNDGVSGFQQLKPDQRIAAVGYAITAANVLDGAITAAKLADQSVTAAKLASQSVTSAAIAPLSISGNKLQDDSILTRHLPSGVITEEKIATDAIARHHLQDNLILPLHIQEDYSLWQKNTVNGSLFHTSGNIGIGYNNPETVLDVRGASEELARFTGSGGTGTWLGLENSSPGGQRWSLISTGDQNSEGAGSLLFFASGGRKMQLDSNGNLSVAGSISAANLPPSPAVQYSQANNGIDLASDTWVDIGAITVQAPASGYLFISAFASMVVYSASGDFEFVLDEGRTSNRLTQTSWTFNGDAPAYNTVHLSWILPVAGAGEVHLKTVGFQHKASARTFVRSHNLTAIYIPRLAQ